MNSIERAMRMGSAGVEGCAVMRRLVGRLAIEPILTRWLGGAHGCLRCRRPQKLCTCGSRSVCTKNTLGMLLLKMFL